MTGLGRSEPCSPPSEAALVNPEVMLELSEKAPAAQREKREQSERQAVSLGPSRRSGRIQSQAEEGAQAEPAEPEPRDDRLSIASDAAVAAMCSLNLSLW